MTNESTYVPSEVQTPRGNSRPTHPHRSDRTSRGKAVRITTSHSRARRYKGWVLAPTERTQEEKTNILTNTTPKPTYKI